MLIFTFIKILALWPLGCVMISGAYGKRLKLWQVILVWGMLFVGSIPDGPGGGIMLMIGWCFPVIAWGFGKGNGLLFFGPELKQLQHVKQEKIQDSHIEPTE